MPVEQTPSQGAPGQSPGQIQDQARLTQVQTIIGAVANTRPTAGHFPPTAIHTADRAQITGGIIMGGTIAGGIIMGSLQSQAASSSRR